MNKFYLGKYLIALYDNNDMCVGSFCNAKELAKAFNKNDVWCTLNRALERNSTIYGYTVHLINVYEEHNDIFSEEDKIFLETCKPSKTNKEICKELNINERTFYRKKEILNKMAQKSLNF